MGSRRILLLVLKLRLELVQKRMWFQKLEPKVINFGLVSASLHFTAHDYYAILNIDDRRRGGYAAAFPIYG